LWPKSGLFDGREKIFFGRKGIDFPANVVIIVVTMEFEWDEKKNLENLRKHGLDFTDARQVFQNPVLVKLDDREDYGEDRWIGIGMTLNGIVVVFAFTEKDEETIRMISMRKATKNERTRYQKVIKDELDKD
jgi:uncharacterized protein